MTSETPAAITTQQFDETAPETILREAAELMKRAGVVSDALARLRNTGAAMTRDFLILPAQAPAAEGMALMERRRATGLVVVNNAVARQPLGMFTEHEALRLLCSGRRLEDTPLADAMAPLVTTTGIELSLQDAALQMDKHQIRHLVVVDAAGQIIGLLLKETLLEYYRNEQQLMARALLDNETKYQALLDLLPVGVTITDPAGNLLEANRVFEQMFGFQRKNQLLTDIGTPPLEIVRPNGSPMPAAELAGMRALAEDCSIENVEMGIRRPDGQIVWLNTASTPIPLENYGVAIVFDDVSDVASLKESQHKLEHLSHFDTLTHLPNRALLGDRLQQALAVARRAGTLLAVCYLDLDNFKPINDTHGNQVGDQLLTVVAGRIKSSLRGGDTVARLGGDEFVLLLGEIEHIKELEQTLSRILTIIAAPYIVDGLKLQVSASIGVTIASTDCGDPDTLLRHADQAMYMAKQAGSNCYHLFDVVEEKRARTHRDNQMRISQALAEREFLLYYQPKVNMRTGQVTGLEALIRWQHPERGLLAPQEFLPLIEGHECNITIGEWVMGEALRQVCIWAESGLELPVSVNIAAQHLQHPSFVAKLADLLAALSAEFPAMQPSWLELEILETAALEDMNYVSQVIDACMSLGVGFALDDFGTGYSSLTYLKRLQANTLKIDQSFVRDMLDDCDDLAIVEGVVGLTTAFGRSVIAEGVETIQHGMMLMHLGCDLAQGFGIARPMPAAAVPLWVESFRPSPAWLNSLSYPWNREDFPLLAVELDHQRWVERLLESLVAPTALEENFFKPGDCRFGSWYNSHGTAKFGHMAEFTDIGRLHEHVYRLGERIAQLYSNENSHLAEALIPHLHAANEDLYDGFSKLRREIADQQQMPPTHWAHIRSC